jgi:anti-anti-sigma regulatory factor
MIMIDTRIVDRDQVRLQLGELLDLAEVRRFRDTLTADQAPQSVQLDLSRVRSADGAAILLLEADLSRLEEAGSRVSLQRLPRRLQVQLHLHPILRFASDVDELFTDPDLEWPGFRHSER